MWEIIIKAGSLVFIIFLGFVLRRMQLLQKEDCRTLMMLIMNVTLPAAVIASFQDYKRDMSLIFVALIAIGMNGFMSLAGYMSADRKDKKEQSLIIQDITWEPSPCHICKAFWVRQVLWQPAFLIRGMPLCVLAWCM